MLRGVTAIAVFGVLVGVPSVANADPVRDDQQPMLRSLDAGKAWQKSKGKGVTVAVLDSGVDGGHRDLSGSVVGGKDFTEGANPPGVKPKRLHGTYMASLIAGHGHGGGGGDGIVGVAPEAKILSIRVLLENEEPGFRLFNSNEKYEDVIADGIRHAVDKGADIINMSLGKTFPTKQEREAVSYAFSKGVVIVAAAGNDGEKKDKAGFTPYSYPASFPGVISVAAVDRSHKRAKFSNRNSAVLVAAPGVRVPGAGPGNQYWLGDGTSQASALVAGVAALIRAQHPKMSPALVVQAITAGAKHRPSAGYSADVGFGEVNAAAALAEADKIAKYSIQGAGMAGNKRVGDPGPVRVVYRDTGRMGLYGGIALACAVLILAALMVIVVLARRSRGDRKLVHNSIRP